MDTSATTQAQTAPATPAPGQAQPETSAAPAPVVTAQPTLEQKIELAAAEAAQVAGIFSPALAAVLQSGVAIEPVVTGFIGLLVGIFKHHASTAAPAPTV